MFKTEWILGLIGSILAALEVVLIVIFSIVFGVFFSSGHLPSLMGADAPFIFETISSMIGIIMIVAGVLAASVAVLGFIGTAKLKKDDKQGGVLLIIAGVISFFSVGLITAALFLVGGIMASSKKQPAE